MFPPDSETAVIVPRSCLSILTCDLTLPGRTRRFFRCVGPELKFSLFYTCINSQTFVLSHILPSFRKWTPKVTRPFYEKKSLTPLLYETHHVFNYSPVIYLLPDFRGHKEHSDRECLNFLSEFYVTFQSVVNRKGSQSRVQIQIRCVTSLLSKITVNYLLLSFYVIIS